MNKTFKALVFSVTFGALISCGQKVEVLTGQENILMELIIGLTTTEKLAKTHLNKRFEFSGQFTGRTTEGNATIVIIEFGKAVCRFTDQEQQSVVSKIGPGALGRWMWTGTLTAIENGNLMFTDCYFRDRWSKIQ
jgi:hypothetical protein